MRGLGTCWTVVIGKVSFWAYGSRFGSGESSAGKCGRVGFGGMYGSSIGCGATGRMFVITFAPVATFL